MVGDFNIDGVLFGNRCYDVDIQCCEVQGNIVFQVFDFGNLNVWSWYNFVECNCWLNGSLDFCNFNFIV